MTTTEPSNQLCGLKTGWGGEDEVGCREPLPCPKHPPCRRCGLAPYALCGDAGGQFVCGHPLCPVHGCPLGHGGQKAAEWTPPFDPSEPHQHDPYDDVRSGPGCRHCGGPANAGPHLRWNARQRTPEPDPVQQAIDAREPDPPPLDAIRERLATRPSHTWEDIATLWREQCEDAWKLYAAEHARVKVLEHTADGLRVGLEAEREEHNRTRLAWADDMASRPLARLRRWASEYARRWRYTR
jgi:hypothetical protein